MTPPVFSTVSASAAVKAALGTNPVRVFPFGQAPDTVADPYCVWQITGGTPENYLTNTPDNDFYVVQFDVYGTTDASVTAAAKALRDAIEPKAHITLWGGTTRDPATKRFRLMFSADWWVQRF